MGLETGNTIADLNINWPLGSDPKSQGDDHLRLVKAVLANDVVSKAAGGTIDGDLDVVGTVTADVLDVNGLATVAALTVTTGPISLAGDLLVDGELTVTGDVLAVDVVADRLVGGDGLVSAPAFTFETDLDSGLWSPAPGEVDLAINGANVMRATPGAVEVSVRAKSAQLTLVSSGSVTVDMALQNVQFCVLDANTVFAFTNPVLGQWVTLIIKQGATGGTATWAGITRWLGGNIPPALSVGAGVYDVVSVYVPEPGVVVAGFSGG